MSCIQDCGQNWYCNHFQITVELYKLNIAYSNHVKKSQDNLGSEIYSDLCSDVVLLLYLLPLPFWV